MATTDDPSAPAPAPTPDGGQETGRLGPLVGLAITLLAVGVAIAFGASRGDDSSRIVAEVAALHDRAAQGDPPATPAEPAGFAHWVLRAGWTPTGAREDVLEGRDTATVFWERAGRRIAHTRISGAPVDVPDDPRRTGRRGVLLRSLDLDGRTVVAWTESGSTSVISAIGISRGSLYDLAAGPPLR